MKVSLNWARDLAKRYQDIDLIDVSTEELVKLATERLGGVEGYEGIGKKYDGIVVAKVVSCNKHPNADKLNVCKIDDGGAIKGVKRDDNGLVQVVCGAPNVKEGLLVAWIPPKATVPSTYNDVPPFVLEARELRGEISNGMLASPQELAMSDDHSGILEIDEEVMPGTLFKNLYGLDDVILEIENKMFTHRPDCFGQLGVARELAGIQHKAFKSPAWYVSPEPIRGKSSTEVKGLNVTVKDPDLCPRYMAVVIEGVDIKPSPIWLQSYLKRVGVRPINNVVDITNYIMLETAQPLHAFDFDKVAQNGKAEIIVRRPKAGEKMTLLDGKEVEPHKDAVLICDASGPIALGGVMGGGNSEIDENTKRVVLECATFDMYNIRRTSMIHGIFTDAVTRFTKGQPPAQLPAVLTKTVSMLSEIIGAHQVGEPVDSANGKKIEDQGYIEVTSKFINERLGAKLSDTEIIDLLKNVEFEAHKASGPISVTPPFWRTDIEIAEDIVEEVGRLHGFNQLPVTLPQRSIAPVTPESMRVLKSELRAALSRAGANEVLSYSFVHGDLLKKANQDVTQAFAIRNALSPDLQYYRLSLLPSLLDKVRPNIKAGYDEFTLFEIGKTHNKLLIDEKTKLPDEPNYLEMVYTNAKPQTGAAYFKLLRTVDETLSQLGMQYKLVPVEEDTVLQILKPFDPARSAYVYDTTGSGGMIGFIGELQPSVIKAFKLPDYTAAAVLGLDGPAFEAKNRTTGGAYKPLSRYQSSKQDLTLKVAESVSFAQLKDLLEAELAKTEYDTVLTSLGVYQKEGETTKNISFRITLSHFERTLTTTEVNKLIESIVLLADKSLGAEQV